MTLVEWSAAEHHMCGGRMTEGGEKMCVYYESGGRYMSCMQRAWAEDQRHIQSGMQNVSLIVVAW